MLPARRRCEHVDAFGIGRGLFSPSIGFDVGSWCPNRGLLAMREPQQRNRRPVSPLAGVQRHLVQARVAGYCAVRRPCPRCRHLRALKDTRTRRLNSLFGTIEVPAPRFRPCPCAVTARSTLCPASELMPDRCTPEYERTLAKMGAWLPYRRARRFLSEFFPLGADLPWHETIRRRTARVGVDIEREVVSREIATAGAAVGNDHGVDRRRACPDGAWSHRQNVRGDGGTGQQ